MSFLKIVQLEDELVINNKIVNIKLDNPNEHGQSLFPPVSHINTLKFMVATKNSINLKYLLLSRTELIQINFI